MKPIHVSVTRRLSAPADRVYDILADYTVGHRLILPARVFTDLSVERGGRGEGTVIHFGMKAFGKVNRARALVSEPEPGRVLVERALNGKGFEAVDETGVVTTFVVDPVGEGPRETTDVTIDTRWTPKGAGAWFERLVAPPFLKRLYVEELGNLEKVATDTL